jgi:outer membrane protein insertion porin family
MVLLGLALAGCTAMSGCAAPATGPWGPPLLGGPEVPVIEVPTQTPTRQQSIESPPEIEPGDGTIIRGQSPTYSPPPAYNPSVPQSGYGQPSYGGYATEAAPGGGGYLRGPTPVSGGTPTTTTFQPAANPAFGGPPLPAPPAEAMPGGLPPITFAPTQPTFLPPSNITPTDEEIAATPAPIDVFVEETRTGRFMFGVAVNSDAGVTGQVTIDERNFDIMRWPRSWDDFVQGGAFRGAGQGFRIEAQPGSQVQRYLVSFTNPYFFDTNISFGASAFYFDRNYFDYSESRYGGRLQWGYRLTPDLSLSGAIRIENINIFNPRVNGVQELDDALGRSDLYTGRVSIMHDTRDLPFMPTEGHLIEVSFEQAFGSFDYPRGEFDYSQYFLVRERPDGSGRHTLAFTSKLGFSGSDTPIFENYFAGGYSTLRGFAFRGASPVDNGVRVGGEFRWLNSVEYFFPITADDMIKGVLFTDFGTVEEDIAMRPENFRVAPGFGFRVNVPALGPAPLAFDFAFPVARATGDNEQMFSFFFGALR